MSVIEDAVSKIEDWRGKSISIQSLSGGLTNSNYKVTVDGTPYFVRVPGESTELLAVDRKNEHFNSQAAAEAGVGPEVLYYLPDFQVMVLEFIEGNTMSKETLKAPGMPTRMAQAIKKLHEGPRFLTDFNIFRLTEYYLKICADRSIPIPG
jgi:thiamine kinase-like enzyme